MKEFLNQCFCKSPESRPSASTLLGGPLFAKSLALKVLAYICLQSKLLTLQDADYHSIRQSVVDFHRTLTLKNLKAPLPVSSKTLGTPKSSYKMPALPKYEELVQAREAVATLKAEHSKLQEEFQKLSEENKKLQVFIFLLTLVLINSTILTLKPATFKIISLLLKFYCENTKKISNFSHKISVLTTFKEIF